MQLRMPTLRAVCLGLALCAGQAGHMAHAGLFSDDEAREAIVKLREQRAQDQATQEAFQKIQAEQLERMGRTLLEMSNQLDSMRSEMARLRGQNEVLGKTLADLQQHQKDLQQGVNERVSKLEPRDIQLDGKSFKAEPDEAALFDDALKALRDADFQVALSQFQQLFKRYPATGYRETALYWQGNAHYGLRACKPAMESFQELVKFSPRHQRAPEALLAIANCQAELKEPTQSRSTMQALIKSYPDSEAAQVARERLAVLKPSSTATPKVNTAAGNKPRKKP